MHNSKAEFFACIKANAAHWSAKGVAFFSGSSVNSQHICDVLAAKSRLDQHSSGRRTRTHAALGDGKWAVAALGQIRSPRDLCAWRSDRKTARFAVSITPN
jgi:hypothetical protein